MLVGTKVSLSDLNAAPPASCCTAGAQAAWSRRWLRLTFSSPLPLICSLLSRLCILLLCFPAFPTSASFICASICAISPPSSLCSAPGSLHLHLHIFLPLRQLLQLLFTASSLSFLLPYFSTLVHILSFVFCVFFWVSSTPSSVLSNTNFFFVLFQHSSFLPPLMLHLLCPIQFLFMQLSVLLLSFSYYAGHLLCTYSSFLGPSCYAFFLHLIFLSFLVPFQYFLYYFGFFFFTFHFSQLQYFPPTAYLFLFRFLISLLPLSPCLLSASHTISFFFLDISDGCPPFIPSLPLPNYCSRSLYLLFSCLIDLLFHTSPLLVLLRLLMQVEGLWPAHPQGDPPSTLSGTWGSSATRIRGCIQGGTPPLSWRQ